MNWADITIICIILLSALISLFRGFIREILSLLAWVGAFWAATLFAHPVAAALEPYIAMPAVRTVLAFVGILILTLLLCGIVNFLVGRLLARTGLTGPDRLFGAVFGLLRGAAIVAILVFLAGLTPLPGMSWWHESRMLGSFEAAALIAVAWLPPELGRHFSYAG